MAGDHRFRSITEIWLEGDHYKWRAMRANGVPERFCTGDASDWEKFEAWARTVPETLRNPLYHWTAMELKRPFGIERAPHARHRARDLRPLQRAAARGRLHDAWACCEQWKVAVVCTTDDPVGLAGAAPRARRAQGPRDARLPDLAARHGAHRRRRRRSWNAWVGKLEAAAGRLDRDLRRPRCEALDAAPRASSTSTGCRASDHGLEQLARRALHRRRRRPRSFDAAARGQRARRRRGARASGRALLHRLALHGPRARLGAAVPPRRPAQQRTRACAGRSAPTPASTPSATSSRRAPLAALPRPASTRPTSWPRPSSTT